MGAPILKLEKRARTRRVNSVISTLTAAYKTHELQAVTRKKPFRVLIGGILSARAKDTMTAPVCRELFKMADNPASLLEIPEKKLIKIIKPIGFYNQKARALLGTCRILLDKYAGEVPATREELMALPGVGRKIANLVLSEAFGQDAICVDTHVHRISNRLGWVETDSVLETEDGLTALVPRKQWKRINYALVRHGQECCHPVIPWCSKCPVAQACEKSDVKRSR